MRVTFLGTGTSHGIPVIGCDCAVCRSTEPHNQRLRPSVFVETNDAHILIDATPDFRTQALQAGLRRVDAVLLTHTHADHVFGLDELRVFTTHTGQPMPIYGSTSALADVQRLFPYACKDKPSWPTLPHFALRPIEPGCPFEIAGLNILPVELPHGHARVLGFIFRREFAYLTDCNEVAPTLVESLKGVTVLVLDGLRHRPHPTHLTIAAATEIALRVGAKQTWLTHINHDIDHAPTERDLPAAVRLAYDSLQIEVNEDECKIIR
jgi:phosphoribosyl 1,2-cyclic phosphate phosphodiesterase